jgi:hypothetical protein
MYISGGPVGPMLEHEQEHPHLKVWAADPMLAVLELYSVT